jgi:hypothetical protein
MFLPERFRLPAHIRDPVAVQTNLNFHASVICVHHAAIEKSDKYGLPLHIKQASQARLKTAAEEVINILRLTSHINTGYVRYNLLKFPVIVGDHSLTNNRTEKPSRRTIHVLCRVGLHLSSAEQP